MGLIPCSVCQLESIGHFIEPLWHIEFLPQSELGDDMLWLKAKAILENSLI